MAVPAPRPSVEPSRSGHEGFAPEFIPVRETVLVDGIREPVIGPMNVNTDRIEWLYVRGKIETRQWAAARKLEQDWELACIQPRASTVLVGAGGGEHNLPNDTKVAAMRRHGTAIKALGRGWKIVELVVQDRKSVEEASSALGMAPLIGSGYLQLALHILADHYGIPGEIPRALIVSLTPKSSPSRSQPAR